MTAFMRLSRFDRLVVDGISYQFKAQSDVEVVFERTDSAFGTRIFTNSELKDTLKLPTTVFERDYFRPEAVKERRNANFDAIGDLPEKMRGQVLWKLAYCQAFHSLETDGRVKRTDASIEAALPLMMAIVDRQDVVNQYQWKRPRAGREITRRKPPCATSLRKWLKKYEEGGQSPLNLIPRYHRCGNRSDRFCGAGRRIIAEALNEFLTQQQVSAKIVYDECKRRFKEENQRRQNAGQAELRLPSKRKIERAVKALDPYFTRVHRRGAAETNRDLVIWENGLDATYPLERVEIDEWNVDLIGILADRGALCSLSPEELAQIERGRRWLYVAIDCATRCIVGMRLAVQPNTADAIATLADITRDKGQLAIAAGCSSSWDQSGGLVSVVTDQGAAFANDVFHTAVHDAGGHVETPTAGVPKLRGKVERVFGTFGTALMPRLIGRTFGNPKSRGDYPSEDVASISDDALMQMLVLYVVDVYHNQPHKGLKGETPRNCWQRLSAEKGVAPDISDRTRKRAFGLKLTRTVTGKGVSAFGIDYTCAALRHFFLHDHDTEVDIRIDPTDLGWIMVRIGKEWFAAISLQRCFEGVSLEDWRAAALELRLKHRSEAALYEDVVVGALKRIAQINEQEQDRFGNHLRRITPQGLQHAHDDLFLGLSIEAEHPGGFDLPPEKDLFGRLIPISEEGEENSEELTTDDRSNESQVRDQQDWSWEDD